MVGKFMFAETKREVLVEYPLEIVWDTLIYLFPVKYYRLRDEDHQTHSVAVVDEFNAEFIMYIYLMENTGNSTIISFDADYPAAIADLTGGGKDAINLVLEELLNELDKQHNDDYHPFNENSDIEVVNAKTFVNPSHTEKNTLSIILGYALCFLSFFLPFIGLSNYNPSSSLMAIVTIIGVVCLSFAISVSVIIQYEENPKTKMHGRIQLCLCGLWFIIAGILLHPFLAIAGVVIVGIVIGYFYMRDGKYYLSGFSFNSNKFKLLDVNLKLPKGYVKSDDNRVISVEGERSIINTISLEDNENEPTISLSDGSEFFKGSDSNVTLDESAKSVSTSARYSNGDKEFSFMVRKFVNPKMVCRGLKLEVEKYGSVFHDDKSNGYMADLGDGTYVLSYVQNKNLVIVRTNDEANLRSAFVPKITILGLMELIFGIIIIIFDIFAIFDLGLDYRIIFLSGLASYFLIAGYIHLTSKDDDCPKL